MGNLFDQNQTLKENEVFRTKGKDTAGAVLNRDLKQPTGQKAHENYGNARQQAEPNGMMKEAFGNNEEMTAQLVKDMKAERKSWAGVRGKDGKFVQRYPGALNDIKAQKAEMTGLFELQRVCPGADVNTCREYNALKAYIEKNPEGWGAGAPSQMEGDYKENLTAYTGSLLRYKLTAECLTDEYLSGNITRIYDYAKKLTRYKRTMEQYPDFFYSMPEAMRVVLERKAALGEELETLLDMHLKLHYINVHTGGSDGNTTSLIYNKMSDEEEAQKRAEYKKRLNRFAKRAFAGNEIELAKAFITIAEGEAIYKDREVTAEEPVSKEGTDKIRTELKAERVQTGNIFLKELREKFASKDADTARLFGPYVNIALDEIGNILHLRDKIIKLQKENLAPGRNSGVKGGEIKKAIKLNNKRLLLYTDHIDRYREYLYFLNGDIDMLRKETAEFLKRADHEELLEPVKFKAELQYAEDVVALRSHLKAYKDGGAPGKYVPPRITREKFFSRRAAMITARKNALVYNAKKSAWERMIGKKEKEKGGKGEKKEAGQRGKLTAEEQKKEEKNGISKTIAERAGRYAEENSLSPAGSNRFYLGFMDPDSEFLKDEDILWIYIASQYEPTKDTPARAKAEIARHAVLPWKKFILNMKKEDYEKLVIKRDEDFNSRDYWERRAKIMLGDDVASFLDVLEKYDADLKDDEVKKVKAYGKAMKGISDVIRYHDNICRAPMLKVLEEDGIDHETAFKLALMPDRADGAGKGSGDSGSGSYYEMDERRRLIKRYSRETLGFDIDKEFRHDRGELNNES